MQGGHLWTELSGDRKGGVGAGERRGYLEVKTLSVLVPENSIAAVVFLKGSGLKAKTGLMTTVLYPPPQYCSRW